MEDHLVSNIKLIMIFSLMHVLDMTEPRKLILQNEVISTKQPSHKEGNDNFIGQIPSDTPIGDPYMGIDTPSEEFYNINC